MMHGSLAGSPRVLWPRDLFGPPAVAITRPPAVCLVPGLPLPQAAGSPLTQAHRPAADSIPGPVDLVHMLRPGVPFLCRVVPTGTF